MDYLYHVEVAPGVGYDCIAEEGLKLAVGDVVIVQCERYQDCATVTASHEEGPVVPGQMEELTRETNKGRHVEGHRVPKVLRRASPEDQEKAVQNEATARSMAERSNERIAAHNLDMKLVHTHFSFDERLVIFQFAAEGRVDFRELLRDLSHTLRTRVELRQVGVRDEAAFRGGIGVCGRAFCCSTFLRRFSSISVKMAKVQGLSLNPLNISGACGRLKCCLQYEYSQYRDDLAEDKRRRAECQQGCGGCQAEGEQPEAQEGEVQRPDTAERPERDRNRGRDRAAGGGRPDSNRRRPAAPPRREDRPRPEEAPAAAAAAAPAPLPESPAEAGAQPDPAEGEAGVARRSSRRRRGRRRGRRSGGGEGGGGEGGGGGGGENPSAPSPGGNE